MPSMSNNTYQKYHNEIKASVHDVAWEEMKQAGKEEAELAKASGEVDSDGCPVITVVADGSWAKRSYKSSYSSLSGVVSQCI